MNTLQLKMVIIFILIYVNQKELKIIICVDNIVTIYHTIHTIMENVCIIANLTERNTENWNQKRKNLIPKNIVFPRWLHPLNFDENSIWLHWQTHSNAHSSLWMRTWRMGFIHLICLLIFQLLSGTGHCTLIHAQVVSFLFLFLQGQMFKSYHSWQWVVVSFQRTMAVSRKTQPQAYWKAFSFKRYNYK
jgi:hypothetical protein